MAKSKKSPGEWIQKAVHFLERDIWQIPLRELPRGKSILFKHLRILVLAFRGFNEDKVAMRASALTYYTLFSIVPIVGLAFGIAKGFGLETYLERQLAIALSGREEVLHWILSFSKSILETANGGVVAGVGLLILLFTIFKVMSNIELSFNDIWQVKKGRDWTRMLSDYFAMIFVAPIFLIMSGAATVFLNTQVSQFSKNLDFLSFLSPILLFLVQLVPYLLIWLMLSILYLVMPNTKVKFTSALVAGIIAGTLFQLVQWGYIYFQIGVSRYNAIYGSFAALPLLLMWMQISWLVVLLGAEISYAYQNVDNYEFDVESQNISFLNKKIITIYVMHMLVSYFQKGKSPPDSSEIAQKLEIPNKLVRSVLNDLGDVNLVSEVQLENAKGTGYQPALDISQITLQMVLERLERKGIDFMVVKKTKSLAKIREAISAIGQKIEDSDHNLLLKDLESIEA